jgi:hypothetical protein
MSLRSPVQYMYTVLHRCVYVAWSCINITAQETGMIRTCFERLEDSANALYKCQNASRLRSDLSSYLSQ